MLRSSRKKAASKAINNSSTRWKKPGDLDLRERDAGWGREHAQPKDTNARDQNQPAEAESGTEGTSRNQRSSWASFEPVRNGLVLEGEKNLTDVDV